MKRKFLMLGIGVTLGFGSLLTPVSNTALAIEKNSQLEQEKKEVEHKKSDVKSEIDSKKDELSEINQQQSSVENEIKKLDLAIDEARNKIIEKKAQIEETNQEIERIKKEMEVLKERIQKRDELLRDRMRSLQESGGMVSYLDVLFGAKSFNDFINRINAVSTFVQADRDIIKTHQEDIAKLEKSEKEVQGLLAEHKKQLADLGNLEKDLNNQIVEQNQVMAELDVKEQEMQDELEALEDTEELLAAQAKAIQKEIEAWNRRQKEEEEKKKRQEASGGTYTPPVSNGTFVNPTTGRLTSTMGMRWGKMHWGIDIGKGGRSGNVPVYAAAAGTISRSRLESSYGNVIMITHYINGKQMTTVYAHLDQRFVGQYDRVEQGQLIGYMGNTGHSTGPHLHFEVYNGPYTPTQYRNPASSNAVNPLNYVSFSW